MLDEGGRGEGGAVSPNTDKGLRQARLRRLRKVDDLRNVGEVVARKSDDIRPPALEQSEKGGMVLDLQVDQLNRMPGLPRRLRDQLEAERLEPQEYLRVEERARMYAEKPHEISSFRRSPARPEGSWARDQVGDNRSYRD